MSLYQKVAPVAKAVTGAVVAGLGALGTALTDGAVVPAEWVAVATATLVASYAVWQVPNEGTDPKTGIYEDGHAEAYEPDDF